MPKKILHIFFLINYLPAGTLSVVIKIQFFAKILCQNFILKALFQSAQHLYEKWEGAGSGSIPLTLMDPDPGGPKTGYPTLNLQLSLNWQKHLDGTTTLLTIIVFKQYLLI
jgi:hypothetical protein